MTRYTIKKIVDGVIQRIRKLVVLKQFAIYDRKTASLFSCCISGVMTAWAIGVPSTKTTD